MSAKFDPTIELNPNPILIAVALLVIAAFGVVTMIILTGETKPDAAITAGQ